MQTNLDRMAPPTVTQPKQMPPFGYSAVAYALAFSITMGSTVAQEDYNRRMTIGPASFSALGDRTNIVWFENERSAMESWLSNVISEMHAGISDEAWDDVPDTSKFDIDSIL